MAEYEALKKKATDTMRDRGIDKMLAAADGVVVGFSGGADSVMLLMLLSDLLENTKTKLYAAHLNHMIRGEEADGDEAFCRDFAGRRGVAFISERADVPAAARETGCGIEETARDIRYAFFERIADQIGGDVLIATAHNADDNLETVIFNMLRGAGLRGMAGIPSVRGRYIRPIIGLPSADIRACLGEMGAEYRIDSTNADTDYTRNYIRREIVPAMRRVTPNPEEAVGRMSALLRRDAEYMDGEAAKLVCDGTIELSELNGAHTAVASRAVMQAYMLASGGEALAEVNVNDVLALARKGENGSRIALPEKIYAKIAGGILRFVPNEPESKPEQFCFEAKMGENRFPEWGFSVVLGENSTNFQKEQENIYKLSIHKRVRFDKIVGQIYIRSRRAGDTYRYGGITRKVKKLLCDAKIPQSERDTLPVISDDKGILWIPGFPLRDGTAADGEPSLTLTYFKHRH